VKENKKHAVISWNLLYVVVGGDRG